MDSVGHLSRLQRLFQKLIQLCRKKASPILRLPDGLIEIIFSYLSPLSQVRLALTCKRLCSLSGSALKHEKFRFPRLLALSRPDVILHRAMTDRTRLLLGLEDGYWYFCAKCMKLHPRKEFSRQTIRVDPLETYCMPHAGIVDLCPCNSITYRDKMRIAARLQEIAAQSPEDFKASRRSTVAGVGLKNATINSINGKRCLMHTCSITDDTCVDVKLRMMFALEEDDGLLVRTQYTIPNFSERKPFTEKARGVFVCPHRDLMTWAYTYGSVRSLFCSVCRTSGWATPKSPKHPIIVEVRRYLGLPKWPADEEWSFQCRRVTPEFYTNRQKELDKLVRSFFLKALRENRLLDRAQKRLDRSKQ